MQAGTSMLSVYVWAKELACVLVPKLLSSRHPRWLRCFSLSLFFPEFLSPLLVSVEQLPVNQAGEACPPVCTSIDKKASARPGMMVFLDYQFAFSPTISSG
jgi:hypothetical protein